MSTRPNDLLNAALSLPESERADFAASLIRSLDSPNDPEADAAWAAEVQRRVESIDSGEAKLIPWDDVMASMSERQ